MLQELIHRFELGEGARWVRRLAALLALLALPWWYDTREFRNFNTAEAMEAAQLARNLARGEGFTTRSIRPFSLHLVEQQQGLEAGLAGAPHPDLVTPPLYPVLLAGLMKGLPFDHNPEAMLWRYQPEVLIALWNQLLFFATLWLVFRIAQRLFDTEVGVVSVALLAASDVLWRFTTSGLSTVLAMFLVTAVAWVVVRVSESERAPEPSRRRAVQWAALGGLLIGLAGLTRYTLLALLIPWILLPWCFGARHKLMVGLVGVLVAAGVVAPWILRNQHLSGAPFGVTGYAVYQDTEPWPGERLERSVAPDSPRVEVGYLVRKVLQGALRVTREDVPRMGETGSGLPARGPDPALPQPDGQPAAGVRHPGVHRVLRGAGRGPNAPFGRFAGDQLREPDDSHRPAGRGLRRGSPERAA
ncbi:MAG: glycosyltransferase family 39 protein [Verrucomicrobiales bacterium]|nr:glycosyltransferase family 39 protein [Verrucomicrobiales bacterium]